jgi:hypothetical protein
MAKTDVSNSHWPNFKDLNASQFTYDVWWKSFTTLKHVGERTEGKTNIHLMSQVELRDIGMNKLWILRGLSMGIVMRAHLIVSLKDWAKLHVAYRETLCTMEMTMIRFFYIQYTYPTQNMASSIFFVVCYHVWDDGPNGFVHMHLYLFFFYTSTTFLYVVVSK